MEMPRSRASLLPGGVADGGCEVVQLHGDLRSMRCDLCRTTCKFDRSRESLLLNGTAPECQSCRSQDRGRRDQGKRGITIGSLRPNIVLYGEEHPSADAIGEFTTHDLALLPDMLLILGTSLHVHGLKILVKEFAKAVHSGAGGKVVFVNLTKPPESVWKGIIDYWVAMDCDEWIKCLHHDKLDSWQIQRELDFKAKKNQSPSARPNKAGSSPKIEKMGASNDGKKNSNMTSTTTTIITTTTTTSGSHTVTLPSDFHPTPPLGKARKRSISCSISENPAKKKQVINTFNPVGLLSEPYAQIIQPSPLPSIQNSCNSLSSLEPLTEEKKPCAQGMASPISSGQVEKDSKEGKTSASHNYSPKCSCNGRVPRMWKAFVEDESLVALCEVLYYLAASKLGDFEACLEHKIKLAFKLQLRKTENISTLLSRVDILWEHRSWENLRQFIDTKCRENWWRFDDKVLVDEEDVIKFMICSEV